LQTAAKYDRSGSANAKPLLKDAEVNLGRLESEGCSKSMKKQFQQREYMKRRNSMEYFAECL